MRIEAIQKFSIFFLFLMAMFLIYTKYSPVDKRTINERKAKEIQDVIEIFRDQSSERHQNLLSGNEQNIFLGLYYLVQEVYCPKLVRLGTVRDGGKWVCNPMAVKYAQNCTVYSFGLDNNIVYEQEFMRYTNSTCRMRSIDMNSPPDLSALKTISEVLITKVGAVTTENTTSFTDVLKHFGDNQMEILKIDIEGIEAEIIDQILALQICHILIEVHIKELAKTLQFLEKISRKGYFLYSTEQNPIVYFAKEYSFIHENCMEQYGAILLAKYLSI